MALVGTLTDFSLVDIFQLVALGQKSGAVVVRGWREDQPVAGRVFFSEGDIYGAEYGDLPSDEAVYSLFMATEGDFEFVEGARLPARAIDLPNEVIIMEGIARREAWSRIGADLPSENDVISLVARPRTTRQTFLLEPDMWRIVVAASGAATIGETIACSRLGRFRALQMICDLVDAGLAVVDPSPA